MSISRSKLWLRTILIVRIRASLRISWFSRSRLLRAENSKTCQSPGGALWKIPKTNYCRSSLRSNLNRPAKSPIMISSQTTCQIPKTTAKRSALKLALWRNALNQKSTWKRSTPRFTTRRLTRGWVSSKPNLNSLKTKRSNSKKEKKLPKKRWKEKKISSSKITNGKSSWRTENTFWSTFARSRGALESTFGENAWRSLCGYNCTPFEMPIWKSKIILSSGEVAETLDENRFGAPIIWKSFFATRWPSGPRRWAAEEKRKLSSFSPFSVCWRSKTNEIQQSK